MIGFFSLRPNDFSLIVLHTMLQNLTEKLQHLFSSLRGKQTLNESNLSQAIEQVRLALLEADVSYVVAGEFVRRVKEKALGSSVLKNVSPGQQFIKRVHDELIAFMGSEEVPLNLKGKTSVVMLCGLQGSGKTTTCGKLAAFIAKAHPYKKILMAACDLQRPAAIEQLQKLGEAIKIPVFVEEGASDPLSVARSAFEKAKREAFDVLLIDTAGRLHLDEQLMAQLEEMRRLLEPRELFFVANATLGQDAVRVAVEFDQRLSITGTILTMLDGNARAGAAISICEVTKKPLRFEGVGEKIGDLQLFNPRSMADRILGMGDVINLVKKAQEHFTESEHAELEKKMRKASFTYEDYLKQMSMVRKMGSMKGLLKMLPGMGQMGSLDFADKEFGKLEAMICSMTLGERQERFELEFSRRKRIAKGSGVSLDDVNRMIKGFKRVKEMCKNLPNSKMLKNFEGFKWR
jgi:signal recognition particle subunit SRP54